MVSVSEPRGDRRFGHDGSTLGRACLLSSLLLLLLPLGVRAQEAPEALPVTVHRFAAAHTVSHGLLVPACLVVQEGKILAIGTPDEVEIPEGATVVDHGDGIALPGFVHAASTLFVEGARLRVSGSSRDADQRVTKSLKVTADEARECARSGFTTLSVIKPGGGLLPLAAQLRPIAVADEAAGTLSLADFVVRDRSLLFLGFEPTSALKALFRDHLGKVREHLAAVAAYEKAKAAAKPAEEKKEEKPKEGEEQKEGEKPKEGEEKKPEEEKKAPEKPKLDDEIAALLRAMEGQMPAILHLESAGAYLHFEALLKEHPSFRPVFLFQRESNRFTSECWRVLDRLVARKAAVIMTTGLDSRPRTSVVRVPQRLFLDAGVPVALVPSDTSLRDPEAYLLELASLVRHGLHREEVLRMATLTPAEVLGIAAECGSLEVGKRADFQVFDGDPFAPTSERVEVRVGGQAVWTRAEEAVR